MTVDRILGTFTKCIAKLEKHNEKMNSEAAYHAGAAVEAQTEADRAAAISEKLSALLEV